MRESLGRYSVLLMLDSWMVFFHKKALFPKILISSLFSYYVIKVTFLRKKYIFCPSTLQTKQATKKKHNDQPSRIKKVTSYQ